MSASPEYVVIDGVAYPLAPAGAPVPAAQAPVAPRAASPFTVILAGKAAQERWPEPLATAARNAPEGLVYRVVRETAAYESVPGYACDAITRTLALGEPPNDVRRDVGHGFTTPRASGEACPTQGCTGKIR